MHPIFDDMKSRDAILYSSPILAAGKLSGEDRHSMQNLEMPEPSIFSGAVPPAREGEMLLGIALLGHVHSVYSDFESQGYQPAVHVPEDIRKRELSEGDYRPEFLSQCYRYGDFGLTDLSLGEVPALLVANIHKGDFSLEGQLPEVTELRRHRIDKIHFLGQFVQYEKDAESFLPGGALFSLSKPYHEIRNFLLSAQESGTDVNIIPYADLREDSWEMF